MILTAVYIRFFKSFNFDYLRKSHPGFEPSPWDVTRDGYLFPYVRVPVEPGVTTVVGANESGKSQLLKAVDVVLTGEGAEPADFCRYSQFFAVDETMLRPDFGATFDCSTEEQRTQIAELCEDQELSNVDRFALFRVGGATTVLYVPSSDDNWHGPFDVIDSALDALLPSPFVIHADVPLPDSVPVEFLASGRLASERTRGERGKLLDVLENRSWFGSADTIQKNSASIAQAFSLQDEADEEVERELRLAEDLLVKVAGIDRTAFTELKSAVADGREGFANGIVEKINDRLNSALNLAHWWSQDSKFRLLVTLRDRDLVFTIRDRTGTEYSFAERSHGLKYFLSYLVQYLSHESPADGTREILLMDEPDAYLSSQGQQDLLKVFEAFAYPGDEAEPCQVIYVTHSPFLIDKNHGERIRVLEKGDGDEGTRVVRNASRNHYEPLRSAFGAFVAETTFIGNCNLMLEGQSDQVLLAGVASQLRKRNTPKTQNLDLNVFTLVPAGSASHIPYMTYLARGRDVDRPAVVVLLDSDSAGDAARKDLSRGGPKGKQILDPAYVLQVGDLEDVGLAISRPGGPRDIEDLIPVPLAIEAAKAYADELVGSEAAGKLSALAVEDVDFDGGRLSVHGAVEAMCSKLTDPEFHLDKIGFARALMSIVNGHSNSDLADSIDELLENFRALFKELSARQRKAMRDHNVERSSGRINRVRAAFLMDHPEGASKEEALVLFEELGANLGLTLDADELRLAITRIQHKFELGTDIAEPILNYGEFKEALTSLAYHEDRAVQDDSH